MKKAGIVCDDYKLETFEREFRQAGFFYSVHGGLTPETRMIRVYYMETEHLLVIKSIVNQINDHFKNLKKGGKL
jgi:hypothetical protein